MSAPRTRAFGGIFFALRYKKGGEKTYCLSLRGENLQTIFFENKPRIIATGTIAGPKECAGVVGKFVDKALSDDMFGESTYEKAECKMLTYAIRKAIENGGEREENIDLLISGDLLNQIISASFSARDFDFPFLGVYSACSTLSESFALSAMMVNAGYFQKIVAGTQPIIYNKVELRGMSVQ